MSGDGGSAEALLPSAPSAERMDHDGRKKSREELVTVAEQL